MKRLIVLCALALGLTMQASADEHPYEKPLIEVGTALRHELKNFGDDGWDLIVKVGFRGLKFPGNTGEVVYLARVRAEVAMQDEVWDDSDYASSELRGYKVEFSPIVAERYLGKDGVNEGHLLPVSFSRDLRLDKDTVAKISVTSSRTRGVFVNDRSWAIGAAFAINMLGYKIEKLASGDKNHGFMLADLTAELNASLKLSPEARITLAAGGSGDLTWHRREDDWSTDRRVFAALRATYKHLTTYVEIAKLYTDTFQYGNEVDDEQKEILVGADVRF